MDLVRLLLYEGPGSLVTLAENAARGADEATAAAITESLDALRKLIPPDDSPSADSLFDGMIAFLRGLRSSDSGTKIPELANDYLRWDDKVQQILDELVNHIRSAGGDLSQRGRADHAAHSF